MYTKNILMIITIILFGISNVYAKDTIKTCLTHSVSKKGYSFSNFPSDGSKPFGRYVELLLRLTNILNLELMIIKGKDNKECLSKMRSGEIDIMTSVGDFGGKRDYMELIPYLECITMNWKCKGNDYLNYGISKKSKYVSIISKFKSALSSNDEYIKIYKTKKYTSANSKGGTKSSYINFLNLNPDSEHTQQIKKLIWKYRHLIKK